MPENSENYSEGQNQEEKHDKSSLEEVSNFNELFEVIRQMGGIVSSNGKTYTAEMIKEIVDGIQDQMSYVVPEERDKRNFTENSYWMKAITRSEGLRDKIRELFLKMYWPEKKEGK